MPPNTGFLLPGTHLQTALVTCDANLIVAGVAIDRAIILGQEWYLGLAAALGADDRVHLARCTLGASTHTGRCITASCAAGRTATGQIYQPFLLVKLLFTGRKYKVISALTAFKGFVNEAQLGTSL